MPGFTRYQLQNAPLKVDWYSALYNGSYMVLDCALVLLVGWILWKPMGKYIRGDDIKALRGDGK